MPSKQNPIFLLQPMLSCLVHLIISTTTMINVTKCPMSEVRILDTLYAFKYCKLIFISTFLGIASEQQMRFWIPELFFIVSSPSTKANLYFKRSTPPISKDPNIYCSLLVYIRCSEIVEIVVPFFGVVWHFEKTSPMTHASRFLNFH